MYLFHCASYQLAGWTETLGIGDLVHCDGTNLYVLREGGRMVHVLGFADISTSVQQLVKFGFKEQAYLVCMQCTQSDHSVL